MDKEQNGEAVFVAYHLWREAREALDGLSTDEQERLRMADLWSFQRGEIQDAAISGDAEDDDLEAEKRVLSNAEKLYTAAMSASDLLYEGETAAATLLTLAQKQLD